MQGQADLFLMIMQSGNRKRNVMCASSNFNLLCDKLNYLGLGCVLFVYIMYANTSHNVCGGNEVKPFQPGASIDAPPRLSPSLYFLLCLSSFYLFLPPFLKNIDAQWHNHAALPFSNISCPPLFLWMRLNWYKNPHTYNSLHRKTAFSPPRFHSAYTMTFCPRNIFIGTLESHRLLA